MLESLTTATEPPFVYVYNPLDQDMLYVRHRLLVEPELTRIWSNSTRACCAAPSGVVVDVGSNFGWYAMLSLSLGCSVVAFEPVEAYQDVLRLAAHLNGQAFARRLTLYGNAVLDRPGNFSMLVPLAGVSRAPSSAQPRGEKALPTGPPTLSSHMRTMMGMAALLGPRGQAAVKDVAALSPGTLTYKQPVGAVRLDALVAQPLCMLKIDIEGLEPQALGSARRLLSLQPVQVVQLEINRKKPQACANVRMLRNLLLFGFVLHKVEHTKACWHGECVHAHAARSVASLLSSELAPSWRGAAAPTPSTVDAVGAWAAAEALSVYERLTEYSWNLVAYQQRGRGPLGWLLPDAPLPRAQIAACRTGFGFPFRVPVHAGGGPRRWARRNERSEMT